MQTILPEKFNSGKSNLAGLNNFFTFYLSVVLFSLPLLFVPVIADPFGIARTYLIAFSAWLLALIFVIYRAVKGKIFLQSLSSYFVFLIFFVLGLIGVVFSINKNISVFGSYGNSESSLLLFLSFVLIGFIVSSVKLNIKVLFGALIIGTTLSTIVSLLFYFGFFSKALPEAVREFTLVGSPDRLFSLQIVGITLGFAILGSLKFEKKLIVKDYFVFSLIALSILINGVYLFIGGSVYAILALIVSLTIVLSLSAKDLFVGLKNYLVYAVLGCLLIIAISISVPQIRIRFDFKNYNNEYRLPLKESWYVGVSTLRDYPLFGTGLGNFVKNYSIYRPQSVNDTSYWEVRFIRPFNDLFFWLSCTGFVGFSLFLIFLVLALKIAMDFDRRSATSLIAAIATFTSIATMILISFSFYSLLVLFISLGYLINKKKGPLYTYKSRPFFVFLAVAVFLLGLYLGYKLYPIVSAEYLYRKSLATNNAVNKYNFQRQAIQSDPLEVTYRADNVLTGLYIAKELAKRQDLSQEEKDQAINLIKQAVDDSLVLSNVVDPQNVAVWELRGLVYNTISDIVSNANSFAIDSYQRAIQLEPNNPKLWLTLGGIYYKYNAYQDAVISFNRAVTLKPDYANAKYNLAHALIKIGDIQNALSQMESVLALVKADSEDYKKASRDLEEFKKLYSDLVSKAEEEQKKLQEIPATVESSGIEDTPQEPLVNIDQVNDEDKLQGENLPTF